MWLNDSFVLKYRRTPPTHYHVESSGWVAYMETHRKEVRCWHLEIVNTCAVLLNDKLCEVACAYRATTSYIQQLASAQAHGISWWAYWFYHNLELELEVLRNNELFVPFFMGYSVIWLHSTLKVSTMSSLLHRRTSIQGDFGHNRSKS